jgi:hypothetical protein
MFAGRQGRQWARHVSSLRRYPAAIIALFFAVLAKLSGFGTSTGFTLGKLSGIYASSGHPKDVSGDEVRRRFINPATARWGNPRPRAFIAQFSGPEEGAVFRLATVLSRPTKIQLDTKF